VLLDVSCTFGQVCSPRREVVGFAERHLGVSVSAGSELAASWRTCGRSASIHARGVGGSQCELRRATDDRQHRHADGGEQRLERL
jgi:hypothetical protein